MNDYGIKRILDLDASTLSDQVADLAGERSLSLICGSGRRGHKRSRRGGAECPIIVPSSRRPQGDDMESGGTTQGDGTSHDVEASGGTAASGAMQQGEVAGRGAMEGGAPASATPARKSSEERKEALARAIHTQVAQGARVESQGDYQAILVTGHRPNHLLHFFIGLITLGVWWLVWIAIAVFGGEKRLSVNVDEWGNTNVQKL